MHRTVPVAFLCLIPLAVSQPVYADSYDQCSAKCEKDFAACVEQLPAVTALNAGLLAEQEAECRQKVKACHATCLTLQPENETPEAPDVEPTPPPEI